MTISGLRAAAEAYVRVLTPGLRFEFPITGLDDVGVPVHAVWWRDGPASGGVGYGRDAGRAGCRGDRRGARRPVAGSITRCSSPRRTATPTGRCTTPWWSCRTCTLLAPLPVPGNHRHDDVRE